MEEQNWGENCPGDNFAYIDSNPNLNWNPITGTSLISNLNMTQQSEFTEDVEKIMCDYDLILRVNDKGTKFIAFDIFDYANQKYIFTHKLKQIRE